MVIQVETEQEASNAVTINCLNSFIMFSENIMMRLEQSWIHLTERCCFNLAFIKRTNHKHSRQFIKGTM